MKINIPKTLNYSLGGAVCAGALILASNASAQNLFVSDYTAQNIYQYTPGGTRSTFATGMNYPYGLAFNFAGDLFIANSANNAGESGNITEITRGGTASTFASNVDPIALAFSSSGNLFEADYNSGTIFQYTPGGVQSTFATGLFIPISMAFDSAGNLFVGTGGGDNGAIIKITPGGTQSVFATGLSFPGGMTFNGANLLVTEQDSGTIFQYTPGGVQSTFATTPSSSLNGLAFNGAGDLFVDSAGTGSIIEIAPGGAQSTFASGLGNPAGIAFQPVPEPSVMALGAIGAVAFFVRRRR